MLKEQFIGRNPSHFQVNPVVKAFIVSESFLWSAYNFIVPIFAIFKEFFIFNAFGQKQRANRMGHI